VTSRSRALLDELEAVLSQAPLAELPDLLGRLESLRLGGTVRLMADLRALPPPAVPPDPTTCLTVPAVAAKLGISRWSVYEKICLGGLPAVRDGRQVRVRQVDLARYIEARLDGGRGARTLLRGRD
jgi:excisionase family DNA binding protein